MRQMEKYKIALKNEKLKQYRGIALISLFLNVAVFFYLLLYEEYRIPVSIGLLLILIFILARRHKIKKLRKGHWLNEWLFFLIAFCWLGTENYWLVAISVTMGLLFFLAMKNMEFVFQKKGVEKLNFPRKLFEWDLFDNVLLKDDILTLDFKSNRIMQAEIDPVTDVDETKFNAFVGSQVEMSNISMN